jgi:hypothetical protein
MANRRRLLMIALPVVLALAVIGLVLFQPQKLFIDDRVDEAPAGAGKPAPATPAEAETPAATPAEAAAPKEAARASFRRLEHSTTGQAIVTEFPDGRRVLRFEDFETSNGPDLRVYLSAGSNDARFGKEYGEDFVELGRLKGNIGNQNYEIPAGTDLARYRNAVVWCARFRVGFGVATF